MSTISKEVLVAVCPICKQTQCDCQVVEIQADQITEAPINILGRSALSAVKKWFENPAVKADFERWLKEREEKLKCKPT